MNYKVIIRKCEDPARAMNIAGEIARWTGRTPESVYEIITLKTTCIRKKANENEALRLKGMYEALGAAVELVPVAGGDVPPVKKPAPESDDDEENEEPGRLLTEEEYFRKLMERGDIFYFEDNKRLKITEIVSVFCALLTCVLISTREIDRIDEDFYQKIDFSGKVAVMTTTIDRPAFNDRKEQSRPEPKLTDRTTIRKNKSQGKGGPDGGGGDPRARVTQKGVLGLISGQIKGKTFASADIFGKGGFAENIDAIISGVGGLRTGGGGVGRKGVAGIGYGMGYNSGMGGGSGGIGDLVDNLMSSSFGDAVQLKRRATLEIAQPTFTKGGSLTSGRSKASILRVVMQNIASLRYAYNKRLREKPGLKGKITVKFAIDEFGKVLFCKLEESTLSDSDLETQVVDKINRWRFEEIDKPGDVTEVVYPFVFSQ